MWKPPRDGAHAAPKRPVFLQQVTQPTVLTNVPVGRGKTGLEGGVLISSWTSQPPLEKGETHIPLPWTLGAGAQSLALPGGGDSVSHNHLDPGSLGQEEGMGRYLLSARWAARAPDGE